ncbi:MAG: transcription antitermination factor NusB, partial [Oscillospiraceae bacterium]|nr:transcription antitermination factor NusB [Oscillospiraceae bacterium]
MTRTVAREISVQLGFSLADDPNAVEEMLEGFFDREYYATLGAENELFAEYPGKKQLEYIKTIVRGTISRRDELDGFI